eukprot:6198647-Pleurochrysis_carterae.AAC.1
MPFTLASEGGDRGVAVSGGEMWRGLVRGAVVEGQWGGARTPAVGLHALKYTAEQALAFAGHAIR